MAEWPFGNRHSIWAHWRKFLATVISPQSLRKRTQTIGQGEQIFFFFFPDLSRDALFLFFFFFFPLPSLCVCHTNHGNSPKHIDRNHHQFLRVWGWFGAHPFSVGETLCFPYDNSSIWSLCVCVSRVAHLLRPVELSFYRKLVVTRSITVFCPR